MAIFWPPSKPFTLVTDTLVEPAGIVITGPSGRGCQTVVRPRVPPLRPPKKPPPKGGADGAGAVGVLVLAILQISTTEPVSISIISPTDIPVVLLTYMVVSPFFAGPVRPELARRGRQRQWA